MIRTGLNSCILAGIITLAMSASAAAQVQRIPQKAQGPGFGLENARYIRSGALLFVTFDNNQDFLITEEEIINGARNTFRLADADGDGKMSPIEQRNWAAMITSESDVLGNSRMCARMLEKNVNEDEFAQCLVQFSERFIDRDENGAIRISGLTLDPGEQSSNNEPEDDLARLKRPNVGPNPISGMR